MLTVVFQNKSIAGKRNTARPLLGIPFLVLVTSGTTSTTSTLEFTPLTANIRLSLGSRHTSSSKVLDCLAAVLWSTEKNSVGTCGCNQCQLVECDNLSSGFEDSRTGSLSHTKGTDPKLGHLIHETNIVCHSSYKYTNFIFLARHELNEL